MKAAKSIVVLGGAHESNETLESLKKGFELVSRELGGKSIQWESRVTDAQNKETEQVDFLLTKDNHPNTKGAVDLGITSTSGISGIVNAVKSGAIDLVFVLKESIPEGIDPSKVISFDTNLTEAAKNASLAAPIQIFAESAGSFTNKNGLKQNFEQSMNPIKGLLNASGVVDLIFQKLTEKVEASVGNR